MLDILSITSPIFIIIFAGYALTRGGLFTKTEMRTFGKFVADIALPTLVFKALSERRLAEILNVSYLTAYAVGSLLVFVLGYAWGRRVAHEKPESATFHGMGVSCSNSGFIGYPIMLLTFPSVAGVALALNIVVENLILIPLVLIMAGRDDSHHSVWKTLRTLATRLAGNPLIIALLVGLAASMIELSLPAFIVKTVDMFAATSGALSLFVIGGTLVGLPIQGMSKAATPIVVGKLLMHPLCILLASLAIPVVGLAPIDPVLRSCLILTAALPMMGIYVTLAQRSGQEDSAAVAQLLTTAISFITLSGVLWALTD